MALGACSQEEADERTSAPVEITAQEAVVEPQSDASGVEELTATEDPQTGGQQPEINLAPPELIEKLEPLENSFQLLDKMAGSVSESMQESMRPLTDIATQAGEAAGETLAEAGDAMSEALSHASQDVAPLGEAVLDAVEGDAGEMAAALGSDDPLEANASGISVSDKVVVTIEVTPLAIMPAAMTSTAATQLMRQEISKLGRSFPQGCCAMIPRWKLRSSS